MTGSALLVIDHDDVRILLSEILEAEGIAAYQSVNGLDALSILQEGLRFDCIVLDLELRSRDARHFRAAQVKDERLRDVPIVVMAKDAHDAFGLGADVVVAAPCAVVEVAGAIVDVLRARAPAPPAQDHRPASVEAARVAAPAR